MPVSRSPTKFEGLGTQVAPGVEHSAAVAQASTLQVPPLHLPPLLAAPKAARLVQLRSRPLLPTMTQLSTTHLRSTHSLAPMHCTLRMGPFGVSQIT